MWAAAQDAKASSWQLLMQYASLKQGRNKLLKSGGARHLITMRICKLRAKFWSLPLKKQGVHVHPWHPQFLRPCAL